MSNIDNNVSISSVLVRTHLSINVHISISISSNIRINTNSNINMNVQTYIHTYIQNYIITYIHIYLNMCVCVCNSLYLDSYSYSILFGLSSTGAPHRSSASIWKAGEAHAAVLCRRAFLALEDSGLGVLGV